MKFKELLIVTYDKSELAVFVEGKDFRIWATDEDAHSSKKAWELLGDNEVKEIYASVNHEDTQEVTVILYDRKETNEKIFSTLVLENIVEISKTVGCLLGEESLNYDYGCSEQLRESIVQWAEEFEEWFDAMDDSDDRKDCYFEEIDKFAQERLMQEYGV